MAIGEYEIRDHAQSEYTAYDLTADEIEIIEKRNITQKED